MAKQNRRPAYVQNATGNNIGGDSGGASGTRVEPSFNPKAPMPLLPRRRLGVAASNLSYVSGAVAEGLTDSRCRRPALGSCAGKTGGG